MVPEQRGVGGHQFVPQDYFSRLEKENLFPGDRPLELDVGCGDGGFLLQMAAHHPDRDFLGLERLLGRVRKVCRRAERRGLANVKILRLESGYALEYLLPRAAVSRLHLLFPDPWPKKRHHRRRLLQPTILPACARVLEPRGELLFKTDHEPYYEEALKVIGAPGGFEQFSWEEETFFYPQTDFEAHWLGQGKAIYRARFRKNSSS